MKHRAEILSVGTEILLGNIVNTDAADIAAALAELGIDCYYQTVVGDNPARLRAAVELASSRADILITSGGLGPTTDDLTKQTIAVVSVSLVLGLLISVLDWVFQLGLTNVIH